MDAPKEKPYTLAPVKGGRLPEHAKLLSAALQDLMDNIGPYVLASLAQTVIVLPVVFVFIFVIYAVIGVGAVVGIGGMVALASVVGDDYAGLVLGLGQLVMFFAMFLTIFAMAAGLGALLAPLSASLYRAVVKHQRGEGKLEFGSVFSTITENVGGVMMVQVGLSLAVMVGAMFCYVPGIAVAFLTAFAAPLVYVHGRTPLEAVTIAVNHTKNHLAWHAIWFAMMLVVGIAASYVPILGPAFLLALQVRAYRELFGDGEEPVLDVVA